MSRVLSSLLLFVPLCLAVGCPTGDDDDDEVTCEGTFTATFNGDDFTGESDRTCGWTQQDDALVNIDANDAAGNQMHIYWTDLPGVGTYDVAEYTNYTMTAYWDGQSFQATSGTSTVDTYDGLGGRLTGSFSVEGSSADSSTAMVASGTFDVAVNTPPE